MHPPFTSVAGLQLAVVCMTLILSGIDPRISLAAYSGLSLAAVLLFARIYSLQIMIVLIAVGVSSAMVLGIGRFRGLPSIREIRKITPKLVFRVLLSLILCGLAYFIEPAVALWIPVPDSIIYASLVLLMEGIFVISLETDVLNYIIGILSIFWGFQMVYMILERSILVFAFMSGILLLISLTGSFMLNSEEDHSGESGDSE